MTNPERSVEEIVQIFQHEYGQYTSLGALSIASDWLRNTLHQELHKAREETEKAYGGCHYCYGKGYGTQTASWVGRGYYKKLPTMKFCTCERGKQLEQLLQSELDQPTV